MPTLLPPSPWASENLTTLPHTLTAGKRIPIVAVTRGTVEHITQTDPIAAALIPLFLANPWPDETLAQTAARLLADPRVTVFAQYFESLTTESTAVDWENSFDRINFLFGDEDDMWASASWILRDSSLDENEQCILDVLDYIRMTQLAFLGFYAVVRELYDISSHPGEKSRNHDTTGPEK